MNDNKTATYTRKAIDNYNKQFDRLTINLPKGTKEKIKELTGMSCNGYVNMLISEDMKKRENNNNIL